MTSVHPARRRADRFDAAIGGSSTTPVDPRLHEFVELVAQLRSAPRPVARDSFVADLRSSLMLAAETDLVPARPVPAAKAQRSKRERRIAIALGGFAIVGATTSMAVAAQSALPGGVLYPLKRAIENADSGLSADDAAKGTKLLDHASVRLAELDALSQGSIDQIENRTIETTLTAFSEQANEASGLLLAQYADTGSEQAITDLRVFTNESLASLSRLEAQLPETARPAVLSAAQVLFSIDQLAAEACPGCEGLGILDVPSSLIAADLGRVEVPAVVESAVGVPTAEGPATIRPNPAKAKGPTAAPTPTAADDPIPTLTGGGLLQGAGTTDGPTDGGKKSTSDAGPLGAVGKLLGGKGQTTTTTSGGGSDSSPTGPLPTLGQVVQDTVAGVNELTKTLTDPLTP